MCLLLGKMLWTIRRWNDNYSGFPGRYFPRIDLLSPLIRVHIPAVMDNGDMYCWGTQQYGNMGKGMYSIGINHKIKIPVKVEIPQ